MAKKFKYKVRGTADFPLDMLRYDASYPAGTEDAHSIHNNLRHCPGQDRREARTVTLIGPVEPTAGRWESFGWIVMSNETVKF